MSGNAVDRTDRRVARTRRALIDAFGRLVTHRRLRRIRVADIVAEAEVGRSTFYDHFPSADALHLEAMTGLLGILADAAAGRGDPARTERLLDHFWDNRQRARETLAGRMERRVTRRLAELVEERLAADGGVTLLPARLAALQLAEATLAPVCGWLAAEAPCRADVLAAGLCRTGAAMMKALAGETSRPASGSWTK